MSGARAMGFDTSLRASHCGSRLSGIQFLPITQQEGFALTSGQLIKRFFNYRNQLRLP